MTTSTVTSIAIAIPPEALASRSPAGSSATLLADTITSYQADGIVCHREPRRRQPSPAAPSLVLAAGQPPASYIELRQRCRSSDINSTTAYTGNSVAGISASGANSVTVSNDVIENNHMGLYNSSSTVTGTNDTISGNLGGGIDNASGSLTLSNSTISGNSAQTRRRHL